MLKYPEALNWSPPESLKKKVTELSLYKKIRRIGSSNRALLKYLCRSNMGKPITERELKDKSNSISEDDDLVSEMSTAELYYRLAFIIGVGLVNMEFDEFGEHNFVVYGEVCKILNSAS